MANKKTESIKAVIVSRAAQDIEYCGWKKNKAGMNEKSYSVLIKGGANVVDKKTLSVDNGKITEVTADELAFLKTDPTFLRHLERGFVAITTSKSSAEKIIDQPLKDGDGNEIKDKGAQLTASDFEKNGQKPPVIDPADMGKTKKK